jgi:hypothetical protein
MKRKCVTCKETKPLNKEFWKSTGHIYFYLNCKICYNSFRRSRKYNPIISKRIYTSEQLIFGIKNEPYYVGEFDRQNDLERILSYTYEDIKNELTTEEWTRKLDLECSSKEKELINTVGGFIFSESVVHSQEI